MAIPATGTKRSHEYELGHSDRELKRLAAQARLVNPMTRQFLVAAGIVPGMRVLDVGSGTGEVTFLAAEIVGHNGEVVGTDRSPTAVSTAQAEAKQRSLSNVTFCLGDAAEIQFDRSFDAVVGRYVLMFSADPVVMLRALARHLRPDGTIVFHEVDWRGAKSFPPSPIYDNCHTSIVKTFQKVGTNPTMGLDLYSAFIAAGLPAPTMALHALVGGSSDSLSGIDLLADLAVTMTPVMEQAGVITAAELAPETLQDRMRAELAANDAVVIGRHEVGVWAHVPSSQQKPASNIE